MLRLPVLRLIAACVACLVLGSSGSVARARAQQVAEPATTEVRALWVTRTTLTSPDSIAQMIRAAQEIGRAHV